MLVKKVLIRSYEVGLKFRDGEFKGILKAGKHWIVDPWNKIRVRVVSMRDPWLVDDQLDLIVKSGAIQGRAEVVDLKDYQRALVWIDGRFARVLGPGQHAYWLGTRDVRVEVIDARKAKFEHEDLKSIVRAKRGSTMAGHMQSRNATVLVSCSLTVDMSISSNQACMRSGKMQQTLG